MREFLHMHQSTFSEIAFRVQLTRCRFKLELAQATRGDSVRKQSALELPLEGTGNVQEDEMLDEMHIVVTDE